MSQTTELASTAPLREFMARRARMKRILIAYDQLPAVSVIRANLKERAESIRREFFAV